MSQALQLPLAEHLAMVSRRRRVALAMVGALTAAIVPAVLGAPVAASAASGPCVPPGFTATAAADLLNLKAINLGALGLAVDSVANVTIGRTRSDVAHTAAKHASADAKYVAGSVVGISLPTALLHSHAHQVAPPAHMSPVQHSTVALNSTVLSLGVGNVSASAGQPGPMSCSLATAGTSVADAHVLSGAGHSLLSIPNNLNSLAHTEVSSQGGHLASVATASTGLAGFSLFAGTAAEVDVNVVNAPTLTGVAGGSVATSSVTYTAPVLDVTLPGGVHQTIDASNTSLDFTTAASAHAATALLQGLNLPTIGILDSGVGLVLHLSLGALHKHIGAHSLNANAATLRVGVSLTTPDLPLPLPTGLPTDLPTGLPTDLPTSLPTDLPTGLPSGIGNLAVAPAQTPAADAVVAPKVNKPKAIISLLDLGIGQLTVTATAPRPNVPCGYGSCTPADPCGYRCGGYNGVTANVVDSPNVKIGKVSSAGRTTLAANNSPADDASLPVTGMDITMMLGAGGLLLLLGRFMIGVARRRTAQ